MKHAGFTLVEVIIYIALFSIVVTGLALTALPLIQEHEAIMTNALRAHDALFIESKITYALKNTLRDGDGAITSPSPDESRDTLILSYNGAPRYAFGTSDAFCTPPRICSVLTEALSTDAPLPLHSDRFSVTDVVFTHHPGTPATPPYLTLSYTLGDTPVPTHTFFIPTF